MTTTSWSIEVGHHESTGRRQVRRRGRRGSRRADSRSPEAAIVTVAFLWGPQTCVSAYGHGVIDKVLRSCRKRLRDDVEVVRGAQSIQVVRLDRRVRDMQPALDIAVLEHLMLQKHLLGHPKALM
jgi:hypothetical protein